MSFAAYRDPPPRPDCPQCDDLRYEIEQLRIQLGQQTDLLTRHAIARAYRLTPKGADILTKLYGAYPRPVLRYDLERTTLDPWADEDRVTADNLVSVYVSRIRKALPPNSVLTLHSHGYQLSESGHAAVRQVMEAQG